MTRKKTWTSSFSPTTFHLQWKNLQVQKANYAEEYTKCQARRRHSDVHNISIKMKTKGSLRTWRSIAHRPKPR